ncbi:MAG TPA: hypothetical protein VGO07_03900 [Candidatus Saccharimonadales bacterium]|jgi:hypothetical protein|nr:hypothetical protein [Candidatus Saccharimonadales bacterium]
MAANAVERIRHYNKLLIQQHRFVGGTVLHGYGLSTRVFEWEKDGAYWAWGADYTPHPEGLSWFNRRIVRDGYDYDKELGLPGTAICEAWLSIAEKAGRATMATQFEYSTGAMRGLDPHVAVAENRLDVPFADIDVGHVRGGLGYWRGIPGFPGLTTDTGHAEQLAAALQSAASEVIAQSD